MAAKLAKMAAAPPFVHRTHDIPSSPRNSPPTYPRVTKEPSATSFISSADSAISSAGGSSIATLTFPPSKHTWQSSDDNDDDDGDIEMKPVESDLSSDASDSEVDLTQESIEAAAAAVSSSSSSSSSFVSSISTIKNTQANRRRQALIDPDRRLMPLQGSNTDVGVDSSNSDGPRDRYQCCQKRCWNKKGYGVTFVKDVRSVVNAYGHAVLLHRCCMYMC